MASPKLVAQGERRRQELLDAIAAYRSEHGFSPSMRECADAVGLSLNMTRRHIGRLISDGRLTHVPNVGRSLVPTEDL